MPLFVYLESLKETFSGVGELPAKEEPGRFFNFHVLVHTVDQIRWFGNLLLMNAARCCVVLSVALCHVTLRWTSHRTLRCAAVCCVGRCIGCCVVLRWMQHRVM